MPFQFYPIFLPLRENTFSSSIFFNTTHIQFQVRVQFMDMKSYTVLSQIHTWGSEYFASIKGAIIYL